MKLKDSTFAIIAEKKDSISHKWFNKNIKKHNKEQHVFWEHKNEYYLYDKGVFIRYTENRPKDVTIYNESEFEALLKAEQENERYKETMDRVIAPQVLEMAKFKEENPNATEEEIETKRNELTKKYATIQTFGGMTSTGENAQTFPKNTIFGKEGIAHKHPISEMKDPVKSTESNQVTFTYQTAIDLLAYYTKIDKGIIKIEMP